MGRKFFTLAAIMFTLLLSEANAKISNDNTDRVVAIVSGSVITKQELENRFELMKRQINQTIPKNQLDAIYKKVLNDLINEEVQKQYAETYNITVEDSEVDLAIAEIEKRNNWTHGAFYTIAKGVEDTAKAKIRSDLVRQKIIDRRLRSRVSVTKGEIDRLIENINAGKQAEKKIHQVFIPVDKKEQEKEIQKEIFKIYNQLKDSKTEFVEFSKNFSESSVFGEKIDDLGWFSSGELMPTLDKVLSKLNKGDISRPTLTTNGWHILYVEDIREPEKLSSEPIDEFQLYKLSMKINSQDDLSDQEDAFEEMVEDMETLGDIEETVLKHEDDEAFSKSGALGWVKLQNLPPYAKEEITELEINEFSDIYKNDGYIEIYLLANKREVLPEKLQEFRKRLYNRIMSNRLELAARRFMRDLRRQAYIEIRL